MKVMKQEIGAFVLAALPFVVKIGDRSVETINGVARVRWDYNYAGVVLGIIALLVVYAGQRDLRESFELEDEPRGPHYAIFAAITVLAIYQIAKGAFLI